MKRMTNEQMKIMEAVIDAVRGVVSENGIEYMDRFYRGGGEKMMRDMDSLIEHFGSEVVSIA